MSERNEAAALERTQVAAERGAVHHQIAREVVDRTRAAAGQLRDDRELGPLQPEGREVLVIELADMARRLAQRQRIAAFGSRVVVHRFGSGLTDRQFGQ